MGIACAASRILRALALGTALLFSVLLHGVSDLSAAPNAPVRGYTYTLRPTGHRAAVQELSGRSVAYEYDDTYRLTRESISGLPGQPSGTIDYVLDPVGNRLTRTSTVPGVAATSAAYDANDRLTTDTYDANGNTIAGQIEPGGPLVNDQYDFEDRLIARPAAQVQIVYDGDGNRVRETVAGTTTLYLVDEENSTGYTQVLEELTITNGAPAVTRVYVYGLDLISQDQLLNGDWVASFYGYDGHGTVRYLTETSGTIQNTEDFDGFGVSIARFADVPNDYRYAGEFLDGNAGLYLLRARHLNANSGRFWTRDIFGGLISQPATLHKYVYAYSDPISHLDPLGLDPTLTSLQQAQGNQSAVIRTSSPSTKAAICAANRAAELQRPRILRISCAKMASKFLKRSPYALH